MKAQPYKISEDGNARIQCEPAEATHLWIELPGPFRNRFLPVILRGSRRDHPGPMWTWNGSVDAPTLKPSVPTTGTQMLTDEEADRIAKGEILDLPKIVCHTWITDGKAQFLSDCTHEFAGQTLDLLDLEINL